MLLDSIDFGKIAFNAVQKHSAKVLAGAATMGTSSAHIPTLINDTVDSIIDAYTSEDDFSEAFVDLCSFAGIEAATAVFSEFVREEIVAQWAAKETALNGLVGVAVSQDDVEMFKRLAAS